MKSFRGSLWATVLIMSAAMLSGCNTTKIEAPAVETKKAAPTPAKQVYHYTSRDRECLKRAMYFESKRTSRNGFMAVGTVVMNRLTSGAYPDTICDVVAQKNQFAPGVMTRIMDEATAPDLEGASEAILKGERHPDVKDAMFFHTNGLKFPYKNMSYVAVAGGNAFYEKRGRDGELQTPEPLPAGSYMLAMAQQETSAPQLALNDLTKGPAAPQVGAQEDALPQNTATQAVPVPQAMEVSFEPAPMLVPVPQPKPIAGSQQAALVRQLMAQRSLYR